jgi:hypothetical protein
VHGVPVECRRFLATGVGAKVYSQRGTAEQWIMRLLLGVIAYNLGNLLRRLVALVPRARPL